MEKRSLKLIVNKDGRNYINYKINLPKLWIDKMGITPENKGVVANFENNKIYIEKEEKNEGRKIMRRFRYESGVEVSEKEYAQSLFRSFFEEHFEDIDNILEDIETLEDADLIVKNLWEQWTIDPDVKEIEETEEE